MKTSCSLLSFVLLVTSCTSTSQKVESAAPDIAVAGRFIDAFYSFNQDSLKSVLSEAVSSQPNILYYQKWAECGHYQIIKRHDFIVKNDSVVLCAVTVKDDLMAGLNIDFNVTDTFRITLSQGRIHSVETSSNDPDTYYEAKEWVKKNRPEYVEKACEGIWNGGPTPCECIQGMIKGFKEFVTAVK